MTLVHLHFHRRRTGVTRHVEDVVRSLAGEGARAWGWALDPGLPSAGPSAVLRSARAGGLVLHAHRNLELVVALVMRAVGRGVRVVWTRHAGGRPSWWTQVLAARADVRVAPTRQVADALGLEAEVVPHGVDTGAFQPAADRLKAWAALGVGGERGLAVVGRIRPAKGQGDAVAALIRVLPGAPSWRAVLVGEARGGDRAWVQGLVASAPGVNLVGEQRDVRAWYRGATVVVQPSHAESFSLVLAEAMASGCCVVAARLPHYQALFEEGRTGFSYPVGDVAALASVLGPLLADPSSAEAVGRAAAAAARAQFPLEREVEALRRLYRAEGVG